MRTSSDLLPHRPRNWLPARLPHRTPALARTSIRCPLGKAHAPYPHRWRAAAVTRWPRKGHIHFSLLMPLNRASQPCPKCNALITRIRRTYRSDGGDFLRYRECEFCGHRYKTIQFAEFIAEQGDAALGNTRLFTLHLKLNVDSLRSRNPQRRNGRRLRSSIDQPRQP